MNNKYLTPSLLAFDINNIEKQLIEIKDDIKIIHYDVMDKNYVGNSSFGSEWLNLIHKYKFKIHVHIMALNPIEWAREFACFDFIDYLAIQYEADSIENIIQCINYIKNKNIKPGIAIKHISDFEEYVNLLDMVDYVIIMSVIPGKGGQKFIESSINNLKKVYDYRKRSNKKYKIAIDGGINIDNIHKIREYCDYIVSGSSFMNADLEKRKKMIELTENKAGKNG